MAAQILLVVGCAVFGIMGSLHFIYVFATNKFDVIDKQLVKSMQKSAPVLSPKINLWKAWIGFNYSHSLGALWVPLIYMPLIIGHFEVLQNNMWLTMLLPVMSVCYAILAKKYWFSVPFIGALITLICFTVANYLIHFHT